jgi:hypothetical protein
MFSFAVRNTVILDGRLSCVLSPESNACFHLIHKQFCAPIHGMHLQEKAGLNDPAFQIFYVGDVRSTPASGKPPK